MHAFRKTVALVISFALVGPSMTAAFAETQWERNHPRRDQVNDRLANQNRRINRELKESEITKQQSNQLHREDRAIRQEERTMAKFNERRSIGRRTRLAGRLGGKNSLAPTRQNKVRALAFARQSQFFPRSLARACPL
jgi:hypothetical protein